MSTASPQSILALVRRAHLTPEQFAGILETLPEKQQDVLELFMDALADSDTPDLAAIGAQLTPPVHRTSVKRRLDTATRLIGERLKSMLEENRHG